MRSFFLRAEEYDEIMEVDHDEEDMEMGHDEEDMEVESGTDWLFSGNLTFYTTSLCTHKVFLYEIVCICMKQRLKKSNKALQ